MRSIINHAGIVQKDRVQDWLQKHLGAIPGAKVQIEQFHSIREKWLRKKQA